jgi:hypothetical protein
MAELRLNFDNPGLQTGLDIGSIAADFAQQLIVNRKKVFTTAAKSKDFKAAVYQQINAYNVAADEAAVKTFRELTRAINEDFQYTYKRGIQSVDSAVNNLIRQGYKPESKPQKRQFTALDSFLGSTLFSLLGTLNQAKTTGLNQLIGITASVDTSAADVYQEIDRAQSIYLSKGFQIQSGSGGMRDLSSYAEFTEREQSHKLLLNAKGERSADYGIFYVQFSGHPSSCPLCAPWQLKVVIDNVFSAGRPDGKTPLMSEAIDAGMYHHGCRHEHTSFIPGFDKPELQRKEVASPEETAKRYAIEQQQRDNERGIRDWKLREEAAMTAKEQQKAAAKVQEWQARQHALRRVAKEEGVPFYRQYEREQIGGETKPTIKAAVKNYLENRT